MGLASGCRPERCFQRECRPLDASDVRLYIHAQRSILLARPATPVKLHEGIGSLHASTAGIVRSIIAHPCHSVTFSSCIIRVLFHLQLEFREGNQEYGGGRQWRRPRRGLIMVALFARMAKLADAADLKSAGRKAVGVQVPLRAPTKQRN